ncbi:MAG: RNA polymerase sigma factor, partial [Lachnospiraceae bacterium]|nr:RNA polymerase sigma factor [Lachnospiraceae bacterium]
MTNQEFEAAIRRIGAGDKTGLKEIYEAYAGYIYRVIYEILQNRANAEDVTSDFFIKLWEKAELYRPGNGHKTFLTVMARNMAIDFLRKHRREELTAMLQDIGAPPDDSPPGRPVVGDDTLPVFGSHEPPPEDRVIASLSLQAALATLKAAERQVVSMKILGELTFREIADIMQIPMGTVT